MNKDFNLFRDALENLAESSTSINLNEVLIPSTKPLLIIIDDDQNVREALKLTLSGKYELILCTNGKDGINKTNQSIFAVILDIKMSDMDGFEAFIEIKKKSPFLPIIFHSAYQNLKDPIEIINEYRPFGYVIKGSEGKELLHTIESAVDYFIQINKNSLLVKALQTKNLALHELRDSLEQKVESRTKELTAANQELLKEITIRQNTEIAIKNLLEEKELILKEVHHRIKNNMSTLKSLLILQSRYLKEPTAIDALNDTAGRVQSMMLLYDKLYQSLCFYRISVKDYFLPLIEQIVQNFPNYQTIRIETKIDDFTIDAKKLQSLGIIINELLTNIMKYAFTDKNDGLIIIEMGIQHKANGSFAFLVVQDNGNGLQEFLDSGDSNGFGFRLISLLTKQLNGTIQMKQNNGARVVLEFEM